MRKSFGLMVVCLTAISLAHASADSMAVTQSYNAGPSVLNGMLVESQPHSSGAVIPLVSNDLNRMLGVVVPVSDAPLVLSSPSATTQQVLVANSGRHSILVSNQSGAVRPGDYLTISSLSGIAMKATSQQAEVVGQATGGFNGSNSLGSVALKNSSGASVNESIGSVVATIHLESNPLYKQSSSLLPGFVSAAAKNIASHAVSPVRIYSAAFLLLCTIFISASLLYGAARSSLVAVGRNPLAKRAIGRGLTQVILISLIVLSVGIFIAYLMLRF